MLDKAARRARAEQQLAGLPPLDSDRLAPAPPIAPVLNAHRRIVLTRADAIPLKRVCWLWKDRIPQGEMTLVAGREGQGKSTVVFHLAAQVTRGTLPGESFGQPRVVLVVAAEDSWSHTIRPRLMAANADLTYVYRIEVRTADDLNTALVLPKDLADLEQTAREKDAALCILDPLLSRLDANLDSHKDGDTRRALEPLVRLAQETHMSLVGLIHVNKSGSTDALNTVMGSRAFTAVSRAVLYLAADPEDHARRILAQCKNNLGRMDLPVLSFRVEGVEVGLDDQGKAIWSSRVEWLGESSQSLQEVMEQAASPSGDRTATAEASDWLADYLDSQGGRADSATIKKHGAAAGHSADALKRARQRLRLAAVSTGFPRKTFWTVQSEQASVGAAPTAPTAPTEPRGDISLHTHTHISQSEQSAQLGGPHEAAPTGGDDDALDY